MTPDQLAVLVERGEVHTVVVAFTDHHGQQLGKRLDAGFFLDHVAIHGGHACDYLFTTDVEMNPVAGFEFANWDLGYGDVHLVPDLSTLRLAAWAPGTAWVLADVHDRSDESLVAVAPRSILRRQVERLAALGLEVRGAAELEFFLYDESYRSAAERGYHDLRRSGWYVEDYHLLQSARIEGYVGEVRRSLAASGVPVEGSKGEAAVAQHELNLAYTEVLAAADRHAIAKHAMKEIAEAQGLSVTFMAKPHEDESGSGCHVHVSLWRDDVAAFDGPDGEPTDEFRWFLGGWMAYVADFMVCYAPTINSYKRFRHGSWAPTRVAWAHDNRTTGFRVVGSGSSRRIECRLPGADVDPYLVYAATIASGLAGIEQRIEPPPPVDGDGYRATQVPELPATLEVAVDVFEASEMARRTFGDAVVEHYVHHHRAEVEAFRAAVTDWERRRYFERG